MRYLSPYFDRWRLLAQAHFKNRDGGDSAHRMGALYFLIYLRMRDQNFPHKLCKIYKSLWEMDLIKLQGPIPGWYRRHPDPDKWYSSIQYSSRDMYVPLIIGMGAWGMYWRLSMCLLGFILRLGFTHNIRHNGQYKTEQLQKLHNPRRKWNGYKLRFPDIGFSLISTFIRAFYPFSIPLWPCLFITDLDLYISSILKTKYAEKLPKVSRTGDDINFILELLQAEVWMPTPLSALARKRYAAKRPHMRDFGRQPKWPEYSTKSGPQSALQYYFRKEKGDPPLDKLFKPHVESW